MRGKDLMTRDVRSVRPDTSIAQATRVLTEGGFSAAPVVDADGHLVGIVSAADLLKGRVATDPRAHMLPTEPDMSEPPHRVDQVMTREVVALPASADEAAFAAAMVRHRIKSVPVVDGRVLVGIVAASDLLRSHARTDEHIAADVRAQMDDLAGGTPCEVNVTDGVVTVAGALQSRARTLAAALVESVPGVVRVRVVPSPAATRKPLAPAATSTDHRGLRVLSLDECLERLAGTTLGRLAFDMAGGPVVLPVNYVLDDLGVAFRTTWGSKLALAEERGAVAFEADGVDEDGVGWSVLMTGTAQRVYDGAHLARLEATGLRSWADPGPDACWVRVQPDSVSGREVALALSRA